MDYWLVKFAPFRYSWYDFLRTENLKFIRFAMRRY